MGLGGSKCGALNDTACSSPEETTTALTSLSLSNSLHAPPLSFDLIEEILCRLSVKHLLQLRCVCKSWNSLISRDSNFANKQLRLSTSNHERHHLIRTPIHSPKEFVLCHSPISSIFGSASTTTVQQVNYSIVEILIKEDYGGMRSSICDGMICFKIGSSSAILCNPSIRKFKKLPPIIFPVPDQSFVQSEFTLLHDRFTNNYKIVALNLLGSNKEVHVHIVGTDCWRRIQDFPGPRLTPMPRGIFLNDSVNWLTYDSASRTRLIVSLDLEKESYQKLLIPAFDVITSFISFGILRGCLSIVFQRNEFSDVWIMKEFGNEKSWTKLVSVPYTKECGVYGYSRALYISKDDQVLVDFFNEKYGLVIYDSINNTFKIPNFQKNIQGEMVTEDVYVESLIWPL
ncbi:F-box/kelch-repeat protein At3g23880-like [Vicia villosa]|uniref:F-box/kelch-repeat protein At3g23880-like n=1 Tax=Vicia villosa TaxID=3911 RepID=UPI00273C48A1|nr:F-box/kelch-repeat protein At3g23880-like [Vicia villosa]